MCRLAFSTLRSSTVPVKKQFDPLLTIQFWIGIAPDFMGGFPSSTALLSCTVQLSPLSESAIINCFHWRHGSHFSLWSTWEFTKSKSLTHYDIDIHMLINLSYNYLGVLTWHPKKASKTAELWTTNHTAHKIGIKTQFHPIDTSTSSILTFGILDIACSPSLRYDLLSL